MNHEQISASRRTRPTQWRRSARRHAYGNGALANGNWFFDAPFAAYRQCRIPQPWRTFHEHTTRGRSSRRHRASSISRRSARQSVRTGAAPAHPAGPVPTDPGRRLERLHAGADHRLALGVQPRPGAEGRSAGLRPGVRAVAMAAQGRLWRRVRRQRAGLVPDHRRAHLHHPPHPADLDDPRALRPAASAAPGQVGRDAGPYLRRPLGHQRGHGPPGSRAPRLRHGTDRARPALRTGGRIRRRAATAVARGRAAVLQRPLVMETAGCLCHAQAALCAAIAGQRHRLGRGHRLRGAPFGRGLHHQPGRVGLRQRDRGPARPRRTREGRRAASAGACARCSIPW